MMLRRWLPATLAVLLLVGSAWQPVGAATAPAPDLLTPAFFSDVPTTHWAFWPIKKMADAGVVSLVPGGAFRPDEPITRAELVKMILAARRIDPAGQCAAMFVDVPCSEWYAPYVETAYRLALVDGVGDGLFAPHRPVTREEMLTILVRALGKRWQAAQQSWSDISAVLSRFSDRGQIDSYARPALALALSEGLTSGYPDGTLRPKALATRAEAVALVSRVLLPTDGLQVAYLDGRNVYYTQAMNLTATKYTTGEPGVGTVTYTGVTVRPGAVAVDPNVIPLGSLLYVEGYGYAAAVDIGGAVRGHTIDLFSWEDIPTVNAFGRQPRTVWLLP